LYSLLSVFHREKNPVFSLKERVHPNGIILFFEKKYKIEPGTERQWSRELYCGGAGPEGGMGGASSETRIGGALMCERWYLAGVSSYSEEQQGQTVENKGKCDVFHF
jgi:hypothetical protein